MRGQTIVITGGTSGIGAVAAKQLAEQGARIVLVARDKARAEATMRSLKAANPSATHAVHLADLSQLAEMRRVGEEIAASEPVIDVLINNAGAYFSGHQLNSDGLEQTFATNHMAYFIITALLLDRVKAAPSGRIVSTSSEGHRGRTLDFDNLQAGSGFTAYGNSKLCNILFTRELTRRLAGTGVTANCLHPGFVATRFGDGAGGLMSAVMNVMKRFLAISPEEGAKTIVYLASSTEVQGKSGDYYVKCAPVKTSAAALNAADARKLWDISAKIAGLGA
jgi:NAD(P)-dependent dehydrogenase (short-subunit alcohol dehydrogenase family)